MRLRPRTFAPVLLLVGACLVCWAVEAAGVRFNLTPSVPIGLYRLRSSSLEIGHLVATCLTEPFSAFGLERGYLRQGSCSDGASPVIKHVAASAGEVVEVTAGGVFVDGRRIQNPAPSVDSEGRNLSPLAAGSYPLSQDELWLFSPRENSWDSRFFGPVPIDNVLGVVQPLWTWRLVQHSDKSSGGNCRPAIRSLPESREDHLARPEAAVLLAPALPQLLLPAHQDEDGY